MNKLPMSAALIMLLVLPSFASAGTAIPISSASPIKHIIIIVQENHTFDNYFGTFPGANGIQNDPSTVQPFQITQKITKDLCHSWLCAHQAYANGTMAGFLTAEKMTQTFGY